MQQRQSLDDLFPSTITSRNQNDAGVVTQQDPDPDRFILGLDCSTAKNLTGTLRLHVYGSGLVLIISAPGALRSSEVTPGVFLELTRPVLVL